jgi:hypothetical protein
MSLNVRDAFFVPNLSLAGNHVVKLPLRAVRVKRPVPSTNGKAYDRNIERMALEQIGRVWFPS